MGGMGSGRRYQGGKDTTSDYHALDVRRLQRDGFLAAGQSFAWSWACNGKKEASVNIRTEADRVILGYRHQRGGSSDWTDQSYPVLLAWTPSNYGGKRAWFLCPAQGCGRRVAKLYLGRAIFACRHCYRLAYSSQRESTDDRAARRADKIRLQLGWDVGILSLAGSKPKGMHWHTFKRLTAKHDALVGVSLVGMAKRLKMMEAGLIDIAEDLNLFRKIED